MSQGIRYERKNGILGIGQPKMTVRSNALAFNSAMMSVKSTEGTTSVSFQVDDKEYFLMAAFHKNDVNDYAQRLGPDGGEAKGAGRTVEVQGLMTDHSWLRQISQEKDLRLRQFEAKWDCFEKMWKISFFPPFENKVARATKIDRRVVGIYRYLSQNNVVYIGRGPINDRSRKPHRKIWLFDTIEYTEVPDLKNQKKFEDFWLRKHKEIHGDFPFYNRIHGKRKTRK